VPRTPRPWLEATVAALKADKAKTILFGKRCFKYGEHRDLPWPKLLDFWGMPNLQIVNRDVHIAKSVSEAAYRRSRPSALIEL
jgi:hypothetical protein